MLSPDLKKYRGLHFRYHAGAGFIGSERLGDIARVAPAVGLLFAAAPELYDALYALYMDLEGAGGLIDAPDDRLMENARAALAKARGEK